MKLITKHFGEIDIDEEKIIYFPKGIIAFEENKQFVLINDPEGKTPFSWLQSVDEPNLAFVIINPFIFKKDYEFDLTDEVLDELAIEKKEETIVYVIVVVPEDINKMRANLLAPLIINAQNKKGRQIILNDKRYTTKHLILEELNKLKTGELKNAGVE